MELQLIRNATLRIGYAQHQFVIDPYLAAKHTMPSFTGKSPNPLVELPCSPQEVIAGIDFALISHLHSDHFDPAAQSLLPKTLPLYCQPGDQQTIGEKGFRQVTPVMAAINLDGLVITRTDGQHGTGDVLALMGQVCGFLLQAPGEPTVYWAGDTIWYDAVRQVIEQIQPQIIITHSCGAVWGDSAPIVMDAAQTVAVCRAAPNSTVIATHMEALDHATVSRDALRAYADSAGVGREQLLIPADGARLRF